MKLTRGVKWHLLLVLALVGVMGFAVGCGNNSNPVDYLYETADGGKLPQYLEKPKDAAHVSQIIDADTGGEIEFACAGGNHKFVVGANSIPAICVVEITAWVKQNKNKGVFRLNFGPKRLQFDPPAELLVDAGRMWDDVNNLKLYWYDPETKRWELQETVVAGADGKALFHVKHFSKYAISR